MNSAPPSTPEQGAENDSLRSFFGKTFVAVFVRLTGEAATYLTALMLARWLGAAEFGRYEAMVAGAFVFSSFAAFGFPNAAIKLIPFYRARAEWPYLRGVVFGIWRTVVAVGLLLTIVSISVVDLLNLPERAYWQFGSVLPLFLVLLRYQSSVARALGQVVTTLAPRHILWPLFLLLSIFLFSHSGKIKVGAEQTLGYSISVLGVVVVLQALWIFGRLPEPTRAIRSDYQWRYWLKTALPMLLVDSSFFLQTQIDVLMLSALSTHENVGVYAAATKTLVWVVFFHMAAKIVAPPLYSSLYAGGKLGELRILLLRVTQITLIPALIVGLSLIIFGREVLLFYGDTFVQGYPALVILTLGEIYNVATGSPGWMLQTTGHERACAKIFIYATLLNALINIPLILLFGITGAALSTAITLIFRKTLSVYLVRKTCEMDTSIVGWFGSEPGSLTR